MSPLAENSKWWMTEWQRSRQLAGSPLRHCLYSNYHHRHSRDDATQPHYLHTALLTLISTGKRLIKKKKKVQHDALYIITRCCELRAWDGIKYSQQTLLHTKALKDGSDECIRVSRSGTHWQGRRGGATKTNNRLYQGIEVRGNPL